jgi:hypothetical protein
MSYTSKPRFAAVIVKNKLALVVEPELSRLKLRRRRLISNETITVNEKQKIYDLVGLIVVDDVNESAIASEGHRYAVAYFD